MLYFPALSIPKCLKDFILSIISISQIFMLTQEKKMFYFFQKSKINIYALVFENIT